MYQTYEFHYGWCTKNIDIAKFQIPGKQNGYQRDLR